MRHYYFWRRLLLSAALEFAALTGAPLRPADIDAALRGPGQVKREQRADENDGAPLPIPPGSVE